MATIITSDTIQQDSATSVFTSTGIQKGGFTSNYVIAANRSNNRVELYRQPVGSIPSTVISFAASFAAADVRACKLHENGASSYLFAATSTGLSFWRLDPATISGTNIVADATFAATDPAGFDFAINGSSSYLFISQAASNVLGFVFDPATVSTTAISHSATFAINSPTQLIFYLNSASQAFLFAQTSETPVMWRFNPSSMASNTASPTKTFVFYNFSVGASISFTYNGTSSYFYASRDNTAVPTQSLGLFRFNPMSDTGNQNPSEIFNTVIGCNYISVIPNGPKTVLIASNTTNSANVYIFNPASTSSPDKNKKLEFLTDSPILGIYGAKRGSTLDLFFSISGKLIYWDTDLDTRSVIESTSSTYNPRILKKTASAALSLLQSLNSSDFLRLLKSGATFAGVGIGDSVFGWAITVVTESFLRVNEALVFVGSATVLDKLFTLEIASAASLTLGTGTLYDLPITMASGSTLVLTANTSIGEDFILTSGCTISGNFNLSIAYQRPSGITLVGGATITPPAITLTAPNLTSATFNRVQCRVSLVPGGPISYNNSTGARVSGGNLFVSDDVNLSANTITIAGVSGKITTNSPIRVGGSDLPVPLDPRAVYYPSGAYAGGNAIPLSGTPGGSTIDLVDTGTGSDRWLEVWSELAAPLITSGSLSVDLTGSASAAGVTLSNGDFIVLQAAHWKGNPQSQVPCTASEYFQQTFQYAGNNLSTLESLTSADLHNQFCVIRAKDGSQVTDFILDSSAPGKIQLDTGVTTFSTYDAALYFYFVRSTVAGLRLLRNNIQLLGLNEIRVIGELTIEAQVRAVGSGPFTYRADGQFISADESKQIDWLWSNTVGVPVVTEVPVDLSQDVMGTLAAIAAAVAVPSTGSGLDAAGVRSAIGLASANLDNQLDSLPTVAELNARSLPSADLTAIKTKTDQLAFTTAGRVDATAIGVPTNPLLTNDSRLNNLDATISGVPAAVWTATTRTLSAAGVQAIWDVLTSTLTTAGSVGKRISDFVNASIAAIPTTDNTVNIGAIKTQTDKFVFTTTGRVDATAIGVPTTDNTAAIAAIRAKTDQFAFTTANRVDSTVIDKSGFSLANSQSFSTTGAVGSIAGVAFPANFGSLGINASGHVGRVSLVDTTTTNTDMIAAVGIRSAIGLAAANLDTQIDSLPTLAEFNARTLPSADLTAIKTTTDKFVFTTVGRVDATAIGVPTIDNTTQIAAIRAKTDQLAFTTANRIDATAIGVPTNPLLTNDSRLNSLDATISSRMATFVYTTPPTVAQIWTGFTSGTVAANLVSQFQSGLSTYAGGDTNGVSLLLSRLTNTRAGYLDNLNFTYTAPDNTAIANINTRTARLDGLLVNPGNGDRFSATALSNAPIGSSISAADVWAYNDRSLSAGGGAAIAQAVWNFSTSSVTVPGNAGRQLNRLAKVHGLTAASVTASGSARTTSDGAIAQTITTNNDGSKTMSGAE